MPPKPGKKEVQKQQKKVVEDKTFGLKNKGLLYIYVYILQFMLYNYVISTL